MSERAFVVWKERASDGVEMVAIFAATSDDTTLGDIIAILAEQKVTYTHEQIAAKHCVSSVDAMFAVIERLKDSDDVSVQKSVTYTSSKQLREFFDGAVEAAKALDDASETT